MTFIKRSEDFVCENCGAKVAGSGYTNHCPACLWSKHVDNEPGDRLSQCGGLMRPASLEGASPNYALVHVCQRCGHQKRNKVSPDDSADAIVALADESANS